MCAYVRRIFISDMHAYLLRLSSLGRHSTPLVELTDIYFKVVALMMALITRGAVQVIFFRTWDAGNEELHFGCWVEHATVWIDLWRYIDDPRYLFLYPRFTAAVRRELHML